MKPLVISTLRELQLAGRRSSEVTTALVFFILVVCLFPLGIGPEPALLQRIGPGVIWVAALLATLLALPRLFSSDHADGTLEQLALSPQPLVLLVGGKVLAHWLLCGLPLVLLSPVLGLQFDLSGEAAQVLAIALLLGTPVLSLVGAAGAALTLGVRGGGPLAALLLLPLYVPTLVFGAGAVEASMAGVAVLPQLALLGALLILALTFMPWAATAALRIALE